MQKATIWGLTLAGFELVRSVYPIEVKPADSNEADSQDQEEDVTSGESRKSEEVEELNKKVQMNRIVWENVI